VTQKFDLLKFKKRIFDSFDSIIIDYLNDFSINLRKDLNFKNYYQLHFLSLWCSKKNINKLKNDFGSNKFLIGRGLVFHISPKNVPLNFFYSFSMGLLSGNSNIVKLPNGDFNETEIVIKVANKLLDNKKYHCLKKSNYFIKTTHDDAIIRKISLISDARMIWGGDNTVNYYKNITTPINCLDLSFSDKYSTSIINAKAFSISSSEEKKDIVNKFFKDTMLSDQNACNSPHSLIWVGRCNQTEIKFFWDCMYELIKKKYKFDDIAILDKYSKLTENIISNNEMSNYGNYDNYLYVIKIKTNQNIENLRGINGMFFSINIDNLKFLNKYITKKCQTLTYFGFNNEIIYAEMKRSNIQGVDRIVKFGEAMNFNYIWDGYNIISSLSKNMDYN
jgi:hypothetical protein